MMRGTLGLAVFAVLASDSAAQAHDEIVVGCNAAGKLVARFDETKLYPLPASPIPGIEGYAHALPGFASALDAKPGEDFFPPDPRSNLVFVLEGADEKTAVWNDHGTGPMSAGEIFQLGHPYFDSHPIWIIEEGTAGQPYALRLRLRDTTGRYQESEVFFPRFTPDDGGEAYVCPMRCAGGSLFQEPGRCAVCGMALKLLSGRSYRVHVTPEALRAGDEATLRFRIESPDGELVQGLEVVHEKLLHLLMVSSDLSWFAHEHPELQPDGTFELEFTFPHGGVFTLYHDFTPAGVGMQVVPVEIAVLGDAPAPVPLEVSQNKSQTVDGFTFELTTASPIKSLQMQDLKFRVTRDGKPVTDLEPFLGALGHLIVVREDRKHFVHSHPLEPPAAASAGSARRGGPEVIFSALFPVPGIYKVWGQFQHQGRVLTVPFVIEVVSPRLDAAPPRDTANPEDK